MNLFQIIVISIVTAAFLPPAHLPPVYIWVVVAFVAIYALTHSIMTIHQYIVHKSSSKYYLVAYIHYPPIKSSSLTIRPTRAQTVNPEISITPMSDLNDATSSNTYSTCGFVADSYSKEGNSTFRQVMLGILVTIIVIFIVLLISLVVGTTRTT